MSEQPTAFKDAVQRLATKTSNDAQPNEKPIAEAETQAQWVFARYRYNDPKAKNVLDHLSAGIGYILMNPERSRTDDIKVAFRWANTKNEPMPLHLVKASPTQCDTLNKRINVF
jgi:hypothetical protein